ncbi:MAG: 2-amino-4-oxopentanoate thiolase subunit OrtA [Kosmotogaceae bacterium]
MNAKKGDWVQIKRIVLKPEERSSNVPEDTSRVPLEMRLKGYLENETADIGDDVEVKTIIGRTEYGTLIAVNPKYDHGFGEHIKELYDGGTELVELLRKIDNEDDNHE